MAPSITPSRRGVPVLAYSVSDTISQRSCLMFVKCSEDQKTASISLRFSIDIHGFDVAQKISLIYNADNLVPGNCFLSDAVDLPFETVQEVSPRQGTPRLKILSLELKKPCPVLCPPSRSILPKHGVEFPFQQLASLARATEIKVVFDYNRVHRNKQGLFQSFIRDPTEWGNYAIDNVANRFRQADWQVFGPPASALSEAPPLYTDTPGTSLRDCVNKRSRQGEFFKTKQVPSQLTYCVAASSSPSCSPSKRLRLPLAPLQVPTACPDFTCPHTLTYAPLPAHASSPTEKAITVGTTSLTSQHSSAIYTPIHAPSSTEKATTVGTPTYPHTPTYAPPTYAPSPTEEYTPLGTPSPRSQHSPALRVPDFEEVVSNAIKAVLPGFLETLLPDILSQIFAVPPSSPSPSPASSQVRKSTPTPASISSLRTLLRPHVVAHAEAQLHKVYDEVLDCARDVRTTADEDFSKFVEEERTKIFDLVEEEKTIITILADECISNLNRASDEKTDEFENDTAGILQGTEEQFEKVLGNVSDMMNTLNTLEEKMACLRREMELLEKTRAIFNEQQSRDQTVAEGQRRRAVSLPV
jgi:hypothetical protein